MRHSVPIRTSFHWLVSEIDDGPDASGLQNYKAGLILPYGRIGLGGSAGSSASSGRSTEPGRT